MYEFIIHDVPLETGAMSRYKNSAKLRRKMQFTSRYGDQIELFKEEHDHPNGDMIWLPRGVCPINPEADFRSHGVAANFNFTAEPRPNQEEMFAEAEGLVDTVSNGVYVAPTGWGKTVFGYWLANLTGVNTCVVTTKSDIFERWVTDAPKFLGIPQSRVGVIRQDKCEVKDKDFVVSLVQSLSKEDKYPEWVFNYFGHVIYDECHRMPAEQFSSIVGRFSALHQHGLSATPDRKDGKEKLFYAHIGPIRAKAPEKSMIPKVMRFKTEWRCPRVPQKDKKTGKTKIVRIPHAADKIAHIVKLLAVDDERNQLISKVLRMALAKDRMVVGFSTNHMHLEQIERQLVKDGFPKSDIGWYVSASTKAEKQKQQEAIVKPMLLTTWQMMGEGTDLPWYDTAAFFSPRGDVIQPAGRVRREYENKKFPLLLDFMDQDSPVFKGFATRRKDWYEEIGAQIINTWESSNGS